MNEPSRILIEVDGKPVPWARAGQGQKRFTPARQRSYMDLLKFNAACAMHAYLPISGACTIEVLATLPIAPSWTKKRQQAAREGRELPTGKPDWDNLGKIVSDALNSIVYADDKQIVRATVEKAYGDKPSMRITVTNLKDATP